MAKVLVIEDDSAIRGTIRHILEGRGYEAVEVVNGRDGVVALIHTHFVLVICVMPMPVQNGIETIQQLRELDANIPIIAVSGALGVENFSQLDDALVMGAGLVLGRRFTVEQLLAVVDDLLDRGRAI